MKVWVREILLILKYRTDEETLQKEKREILWFLSSYCKAFEKYVRLYIINLKKYFLTAQ